MKIKKHDYLFIFIALALIVLDQITKVMIRNFMVKGESFTLIKNILYLTYVQNTGAAFGILQNTVILLMWFSVIALGFIFYFYDRMHFVPRALLTAGIVGNLIDRIFLKYVTDFIDFRFWPAFNVADSCLSIGVILLLVYIFKK